MEPKLQQEMTNAPLLPTALSASKQVNGKTQAKKSWGALSNLPRAQAVLDACAYLEANSQTLNRENIRALLQGGSDRDIAPILDLYRKRKALQTEFAQIPATLLHLVASQLNQTLAEVQQKVAAHLQQQDAAFQQANAAFNAIEEELERKIDQTELTNLELEGKLQALIEDAHAQQEQIRQQQTQLQTLDGQYKQALVDKERLGDQLRERDIRLEREGQQHKEALTAQEAVMSRQRQELLDQQQKEIDRLMTLQSNERAGWQATQRKWQQDESQYKTTLQGEKSKIDTMSVSIIELTKLNQLLQTEQQRLQQTANQVTELREQLHTAQQELQQRTWEQQGLQAELQKQQQMENQMQAMHETLRLLQQHLVTDPKGSKAP